MLENILFTFLIVGCTAGALGMGFTDTKQKAWGWGLVGAGVGALTVVGAVFFLA